MVLKIEQILGSKTGINLLRKLTLKPYLSFGLSELANELSTSKSNVFRIIQPLKKQKILIESGAKRKKKIKINSSHKLNSKLYEIFMIEKQNQLDPKFKNILDLVYSQINEKVKIFILFGSVAYGLQKEDSDIDICVVGDKSVEGLSFDFFENKIEIHNYSFEDFKRISDFVVLEALLNGVWYKGEEVFEILSNINSVPTSYLIYRLNKAKQFIRKANSLRGQAKKYFMDMAKITLGEIISLLQKKTTIAKRKIKIAISHALIKKIEKRLSEEGEKIWIG
jgi:predicted nucleotidyltransferase